MTDRASFTRWSAQDVQKADVPLASGAATATDGDEGKGKTKNEARRDYANGMFILMRATSVSCTSADFAICRFSFPLFDESR